jgi:hypothetical protein
MATPPNKVFDAGGCFFVCDNLLISVISFETEKSIGWNLYVIANECYLTPQTR